MKVQNVLQAMYGSELMKPPPCLFDFIARSVTRMSQKSKVALSTQLKLR